MKKIAATFLIDSAYCLIYGWNLNNSIFNLEIRRWFSKDLTSQNVEINDLKGGRPFKNGYCLDKPHEPNRYWLSQVVIAKALGDSLPERIFTPIQKNIALPIVAKSVRNSIFEIL
jgi:hypothetical protein